MKKLTLSLMVMFLMLLFSCDKNSTDANDTEINGDFAVTVGDGTTPQYSWTAGDAFSLSVMRSSDTTVIVWGLSSPTGKISSAATHGTTPLGIINTAATEPKLTAGVKYHVSITLLDGKSGLTKFTP